MFTFRQYIHKSKPIFICAWVIACIFSIGLFSARTYAISNSNVAYLINRERGARGIRKLSWNSRLATSSYLKARDMCAKSYFAHISPTGTSPWYFFKKAGYYYRYAGENLAKGFSIDSGVVKAWMASSGHRANILSTRYRDIGVAHRSCTISGKYTTIIVAHFGQVL